MRVNATLHRAVGRVASPENRCVFKARGAIVVMS